MNWLEQHIKTVMIVSGIFTMSMLSVAIAPGYMLNMMFGMNLEGPLAELIVRNWGALIALIGAMLFYAAFRPAVRNLVLVVASISKSVFIALVLINGFGYQLITAVIADTVMVFLYCYYLLKFSD